MKCVLIDAGDRDPAARELLDDHRVGRQVEPHPAVLLGDRDAEQAELLHLLDDRLGERVLVVVVLGVGEDLLVGELAHHLGDRLLLVGLSVSEAATAMGSSLRVRDTWNVSVCVGRGYFAAVNFARDVVERLPAGGSRWSSWRATARAASGRFGEVAERSARLAGHARARTACGRGDVVMTLIGNRPEWVLRDGRLLPHRRRRAAVHRAAAREGPAPAPRRGAAGAGRWPTSATRPSCGGARAPRRAAVAATIPDEALYAAEPAPAVELAPAGPVPDHLHERHRRRAEGASLHAQRYLAGQRLQAEHWLDARAGELVWCTAASGWSKSARNVFIAPWLRGAAALLHDARFDPHERLELLARERVNVLCMAPTEYRVIAKRADAARRCRTCAGWWPPARR